MKKISLLIILLLFLLFSCKKNTTSDLPYYVDLTGNFAKVDFKLSDIVEDIIYIRLECKDENFIKWIYDLRITSDNIFVRDINKILIYNWEGELTAMVDHRGRGPGEYERIHAFELDTASKSLIILATRSLNYYSIEDGRFIKKENLKGNAFVCRLIDNEHFYFGFPPIRGLPEPTHTVINISGDTVHKALNKFLFKSDNNVGIHNEVECYSTPNGTFYKELLDDTLYNVSVEEGFSPYAIFNTGKSGLSIEQRNSDFTENYVNSMLLAGFFETENYIFIGQLYMGSGSLIGYNISENKTFELKDGIENDIDGGLPLKYAIVVNDSLLISSAPVSDILKHELSDVLDVNMNNKKFLELQNTVSENDNPALIIYKLR